MMDDEKTYFTPGQVVRVKHFANAPKMFVVEKKTRSIVDKDGNSDNIFLGILCKWFDKNDVLREAVFSTKDLIHV